MRKTPIMFIVLLLTVSFNPLLIFGAEAPHAVSRVTTAHTMSDTSWTDITGATISSGDLTSGNTYLIIATAQFTLDAINSLFGLRLVHGATPTEFDDSVFYIDLNSSNSYNSYAYYTIWTAASGEDIDLQGQVAVGTNTMSVDQIVLTAIDLTDVTYHSAKDTTDDTLNTTYSDGASVSFSVSSDSDILVLGRTSVENLDLAANTQTRFNHNSGSDVEPVVSLEGENSGETVLHSIMRGYTQTSASGSNTYAIQSRQDAGSSTPDRRGSEIIAIELDTSFTGSDQDYVSTLTAVSDTDFATNLNTISFTPSVTSDSLVMSFAVTEVASSTSGRTQQRIQQDSTDTPSTQTSDSYDFFRRNDVTDAFGYTIHDIVNVSTGGSTIDSDASRDSTIDGIQYRGLVITSLDLAGGGPGPTDPNDDIQQNVGCCLFNFDFATYMLAYLSDFDIFAYGQQNRDEIDRFKIVATATFPSIDLGQLRIDAEQRVLPALENRVNQLLRSEFNGLKFDTDIRLKLINSTSVQIFPEVSYEGRTSISQEERDIIYDGVVDDLIILIDDGVTALGGTVTDFHIHKTFGAIDVAVNP